MFNVLARKMLSIRRITALKVAKTPLITFKTSLRKKHKMQEKCKKVAFFACIFRKKALKYARQPTRTQTTNTYKTS